MHPSLWFFTIAMGATGTIIPVRFVQNEQPVPSVHAAQEDAIAKEFSVRTKAYVAVQKKLEGTLPGLKSSNDAAEIDAHALALRAKIIEARANVPQGNIFSPGISEHFKITIRKTFQEPGSQVVRRTVVEGDAPTPIAIRVNSVYPDTSPVVTTPPTLLSRLPELPMELSYRIVGHTFVLLDNKTNVIVDYIPEAIP